MYVYCRSKYSSDISIYCYTIITLVIVTLYYLWHLSQHKLWSKCIWAPDFINPIHQLRFVMSDCWTSMNNNWWETPTPVVSRAIDTCPCSCGRWQLAKWPRYALIRKQNLVYIYPRCCVIGEYVISLRWWPFWKWRHIGSASQFGDVNIHFSYWDRCQ